MKFMRRFFVVALAAYVGMFVVMGALSVHLGREALHDREPLYAAVYAIVTVGSLVMARRGVDDVVQVWRLRKLGL